MKNNKYNKVCFEHSRFQPPSEATLTLPNLAGGGGSSNSKEERGPALKLTPASSANVSQAVDKADDAPAGTKPVEGLSRFYGRYGLSLI
ncbi:hypothetical protein IscW_ISCW010878 [Ixodes scapularis]|uniref:Uncharacterized protein n=1 Tax=Ixodes scapularis TaxID=6945 RepID=B7Q8J8_IXOSC|nr:hypothetical protein IscW_ISCW010878 [Ixodes scapularis]|eukprot:XP_002405172.1 hypothetical protein IscW_ISCW010878 [Ixodes scapularis]